MPTRPYGPDAIPLSIIGFGGILVDFPEDQQARANELVAEAVERGINYFDVAPQYGEAELRLGPALEAYRDDCFLACKTLERTADAARHEFERSLQRLRTDRLDLYQLHALTHMDKDIEPAFGPGGVVEFVDAMKQEGRIRHLGFSAHSVDAAMAAMHRYDFDSILFPVNFYTWHRGDFGPTVVEQAKRRGMSVLALKALAREPWPEDDPLLQRYPKTWYKPITDRREAELALKFTLSQPVTAAVPPASEELWRLAVELAPKVKPITDAELEALQQHADVNAPIFSR
jgi:aryl-alcohol dehydrogenase-like predicted oxidoreductase